MNVTLPQAIEIYARMMHHRFGSKAPRKARAMAEKLRTRDDIEGAEVWLRVAVHAEKLLCVLMPENATVDRHPAVGGFSQ
jgi:hypothetical protein